MKRAFKTGFAILLVMSVVIGNIPFGTILVCVHADDIHGEKAVHLHYDQIPGQPCNDAPHGVRHENSGEGRRHFFLAPEIPIRTPSSSTRVLSPLLHCAIEPLETEADSIRNSRGSFIFDNPSFAALDTSFTHIIVLII